MTGPNITRVEIAKLDDNNYRIVVFETDVDSSSSSVYDIYEGSFREIMKFTLSTMDESGSLVIRKKSNRG